ncbi:hypothetical protein DPMN_006922 [Dreissena polymorpha]|uniref:Uncharacterized protein n=1 Tax=Dreissena polymorpha TaxID=45954 RepID=A0A9D4RXU4_DREPO|nr:hypothetical protein DPMN_006922 [Dreissena polymorpha]
MTPPPDGHVFLLIRTIFELNCRIQKSNVLTKFHKDWTKHVTSRHDIENCPTPGGHVFSPIWTTFELVRVINKTKVLTNVTSRVNTVPPAGSHIFQRTGTIFNSTNISLRLN